MRNDRKVGIVPLGYFRIEVNVDLLLFHNSSYFANATARVSRITVILTCPG